MARIAGIDIPKDKCIRYALQYIYGIGDPYAVKICEDCKIDPTKRTKDLSEDELNVIRNNVDKELIEGDLRREVSTSIKTQMDIKSYRGVRHIKGLPVRGQRTSRNCRSARSKKGPRKVVANKKK